MHRCTASLALPDIPSEAGTSNKCISNLEDTSLEDASLLVASHRMNHLRCQCCSHQGQILVDRIHDADRPALWRVLCKSYFIQIRPGRRRNNAFPQMRQHCTAFFYLQNGSLTQVASTDRHLGTRQEGRCDVIVAVYGSLPRQHRIIFHILAVCREMHGQFVAVDLRLEV